MLFTVGHSKHEFNYFLELLNKYSINCIIDVRSYPKSKIVPQFDKEDLSLNLKQNSIIYIHMPEEFGARKSDFNLLDLEGKVDFAKVRETECFKEGIERVTQGLTKNYNIALMCAEADPFDCHRFSMISYQFVKNGINVLHILKDGSTIDNSILEQKLLNKYSKILPTNNLFVDNVTDKLRLECAYRLRNKDIAFTSVETDSLYI